MTQALPLTLAVGASTKYQACAPKICTADIAINAKAFTYVPGEYVVVSLLTSLGNVFSAQYPPPQVPSTTYVSVKTVSTNVAVSLVGGGPQLSVMLTATALCSNGQPGCTQTFSCSNGCITVMATVNNLASTDATGVSLSLHTPYSDFVSGTASVASYSACSPASQTIGAGSQGTFTCQFSASTGQSGGLASFSGHATGTLYGVSVTSAEALSNSIEIGGLASVPTQGAFVVNFFYLKYSSCYQNTGSDYVGTCTPNASPMMVSKLPSGAFIAAGANFYTAWYVQITNIFNTTLPIMQYSYTYGDPTISGEVFYFLAGANSSMTNGVYYPNYGANPPMLVGYPTDCNTVNAQNRPTDGKCIYLNPGQTVTLTFAACGYGATNWGWGGQQDASSFDSSTGCTGNPPKITAPEGVQLGIVVSFYYKGNTYSEMMPFQGESYLRSAATSVTCSPSTVVRNTPTTCTATVTDNDGSGTALTPTGTVTFSGQALGLGGFSSMACTLSSGSCSVTYTPYSSTLGIVSMQATYGGDYWHMGSSGSTSIDVVYATTTTVTCSPGSIVVGSHTTCTVTVTSAGSPTGTVTFTSSGSGTFSSTTCTLSGGSCSVTYTPSSVGSGTHTITASYGGDSNNLASSGTFSLTVTKATSTTTVTCSPGSVAMSSTTTCTVTVTSAGSPTGTVTFTSSGSGTFSSTTCTLSGGSCSVTYTPSSVGTGTHTITASYGGDSNNLASSGTFSLTVTKATSTTTVTCSPGSVTVGSHTTCTVTVTGMGLQLGLSPSPRQVLVPSAPPVHTVWRVLLCYIHPDPVLERGPIPSPRATEATRTTSRVRVPSP